jgi:hypothetical protein
MQLFLYMVGILYMIQEDQIQGSGPLSLKIRFGEYDTCIAAMFCPDAYCIIVAILYDYRVDKKSQKNITHRKKEFFGKQ